MPDAICAFLHILVLLALRLQWLMIITFVVIRIPRFILQLIVKRTGETSPVWVSREFIFRKYSCILYFPLAVIMQMITMATNFCMPAGNVKQCYAAYATTLIILLVIHQILDVILFIIVKRAYEKYNADHPNAEADAATKDKYKIEMPANNLA